MQIVVGYFKINGELERRYLCMNKSYTSCWLPCWHPNMGSIFPSSRSAERNLSYWRENNKENAKLLIEAQIKSIN